MEPAKYRPADDRPIPRERAGHWTLMREAAVRAIVALVTRVLREHHVQMALVDHDHRVQTILAHGSAS